LPESLDALLGPVGETVRVNGRARISVDAARLDRLRQMLY
jgi:hypothetical protein